MSPLDACIHMIGKRRLLPNSLGWLREYDMWGPVKVWDAEGEAEIVVDLWPGTVVAIMEAAGRLEACHDPDDLVRILSDCLTEQVANTLTKKHLARRCRELTVEMLKAGLRDWKPPENN